jgi:hypothetical protein
MATTPPVVPDGTLCQPVPAGNRWPRAGERLYSTLSEVTARDNLEIKKVKAEQLLDDIVVVELNDSGFVKSMGLK